MQSLFIVFHVVLIFHMGYVYCQEPTQVLKGQITDQQSGLPLPGATVILPGTEPLTGTTADEDGYYRIENLRIGRYNIKYSYMGYETKLLKNVLVSAGKEKVINLALEEKIISTDVVEIKAKVDKSNPINEMALVSARSFTIEETERYAGSLGDPSRMVSNYAGVMNANDSRNDIIIRGNSPLGLLWVVNDMEVPNPNHFGSLGSTGGPVSMLNNNLLANSDFYSGAFPAEFGNAMAGVFDLNIRNGNRDKREYVFQVGFNGFEAGAEGPFSRKKKKATYIINYRYSTIDLANKIGMDFGPGTSIPEYQDVSFKLDFPNTKTGRYSVFGLGGISEINLDSRKKEDEELSYGVSGTNTVYGSDMALIGVSNLIYLNKKNRIKTIISGTRISSHTKLDSLKLKENGKEYLDETYPFFRSDQAEYILSVKPILISKINAKNLLKTGFSVNNIFTQLYDSVWLYDEQAFKTNNDTEENIFYYQAFFQWQHRFSDDLRTSNGLFFHYLQMNQTYTVEPRLGLSWNFAPSQRFNFGAGLHSQILPRSVYFYESEHNSAILYTNRNLDLQKSIQTVVGYDFLISENTRIKAETYYQYLYDIPIGSNMNKADQRILSLQNFGDYFALPVIDSMQNEGIGKNYGIELTLERFMAQGFYYLLTASVFDSKYKGLDKKWRNTSFNNNYMFNALTGYEFSIGKTSYLTTDIKTTYAGGRYFLPIDLEKSVANGEVRYDFENAYNQKHPDYFRLDLRLGFRINGKKATQEWAVDLQNFTNHKNVFQHYYDHLNEKIGYDYQIGFYPMFLYRIRF